MRNNHILIILLFLSIAPSFASAEVGGSTRDFKHSGLVRTYHFILDETVDVGVYSTMPGKKKFLYKSRDNRYFLELISDKNEEEITSQNLTFFYRSQLSEADQDKACALDFFKEATGGKIEEKVFFELYEVAGRRAGSVQERVSGNVLVSIVLMRHAVSSEWNIVIKKKGF